MTTSLMDPLERETLAEQAVRSLKRYVVAEGLKPGAQLPSERDLCAFLGISRNVVREALRTLVAEGYVSKEPGKGAFLRAFDLKRLESELHEGLPQREQGRDLREVRVALEVGAMSFVVRRISADDLGRLRQLVAGMEDLYAAGKPLRPLDREFHETLILATHNPAMAELRETLFRALRMTSPESSFKVGSIVANPPARRHPASGGRLQQQSCCARSDLAGPHPRRRYALSERS